jgi:iron complex outermembrane recepter protein
MKSQRSVQRRLQPTHALGFHGQHGQHDQHGQHGQHGQHPRPQPIALAVSILLMGFAGHSLAQQAAPGKVDETQTIEVTGIRGSLLKSITAKRNAQSNVEVITAEDVGKMPDKNIADSLSRLSGVNVQFGGALAMDEAERVAIRGTSPNLNLVTINGHALSSGDWHVGDQAGSGRSVGFGLMPSQLIGRSVVYKTGQADITEGGIAGTVDIQTRRPLDFKSSFTAEVAVGAVYADLPRKTDPQLSGLVGFKTDDGKFGVLVQAFSEKRHLRRDGQETFGFNVISAAVATYNGDANLAGKRLPGSLNSALFEGVRERTGGYLGVQFKPLNGLDLNFSAFRVTLKSDNYNSSAFALPNNLINNGWKISKYTIEGDVLTAATFTRPAPLVNANLNLPLPINGATGSGLEGHPNQRVVGLQFDHNQRQGATSLSSFYDFDFNWSLNDQLTFDGRLGLTEGNGLTNSQPTQTYGLINPNVSYQINTGRPTDYNITDSVTGKAIALNNPSNFVQLSNTGAGVKSSDKETYLHLNGVYKFNDGFVDRVRFGLRAAKHEREYSVTAPRWLAQDNADGSPVTPSPFQSVTGGLLVNFAAQGSYSGAPAAGVVTTPIVPNGSVQAPATSYPSNWASGLDANFPRELFRFDPSQLEAFAAQYARWDPVTGKTWNSGYTVEESNNAVYAMADFALEALTGNVGLRLAQTKVSSLAYQQLTTGTGIGQCPVPPQACPNVPGAITGSRFASYLPQLVETTNNTVLPSVNLRYDLSKEWVATASVSRTLGRANYNELAAAITVNNTLLTGTSGNPRLKPVTSTNLDATLAWYFAPQAYAQVGLFSQDLKDYVKAGTSQVDFFNLATNAVATYTVSSRIGVDAKIRGLEASVNVPVGAGFGVLANTTLVDAKDQDGVELLGSSKLTYNLQAWFENDTFSARLAWNHRSDYAFGFVGNGTNTPTNGTHKYKAYGTLDLSAGVNFTKNLSLSLDAKNLLNPVRSTYFITENAPGYWHESGRQFFLTLRGKF